MTHTVSIPGLDYDFCANCRRWIIRDCEVARLEGLIATALARNRGEEATTLSALLSNEKQIRNEPCKVPQSIKPSPSPAPVGLLTLSEP